VTETALDALGQQQWLDPVAEPLTAAVRQTYEAAGESGRALKNAAHGVWLGHPLHPVLTDIPIGSWTTAMALDAAESATGDRGYGRAADVAIGIGLVGAAGAAITGLTDWSETDGRAKRLGLMHGLLNVSATSLYAISFALRRSRSRAAGRAFSVAGLAVASVAAYLGGRLVYGERIGVSHADEGDVDTFTSAMASADLPPDQPRKAEANGVAVMVARQHGRLCALAEHCSHLGGPLSEGTLKTDSIVCPWHGSEFGLTDGHVVNGPATHPQPTFDVRERDGRVEVKRR
jgi:nitrite reductase/ring-hydroxylating ferredoxin subunit/uncharacterized membrane protein